LRPRGPAQGQLERAFGVQARHRIGHALVEGMDDVGTQRLLDLDGDLGREEVGRAVDGRAKLDTGLGDLPELREAEHLEPGAAGGEQVERHRIKVAWPYE